LGRYGVVAFRRLDAALGPQEAAHGLEALVLGLAHVGVAATNHLVEAPGLYFARPVRVAQNRARHADQVGAALGQDALGQLRRADLARGHHGNNHALPAQERLDAGRDVQVGGRRVGLAGHAALAAVAGVGVQGLTLAGLGILELAAGADADVIDAGLHQA